MLQLVVGLSAGCASPEPLVPAVSAPRDSPRADSGAAVGGASTRTAPASAPAEASVPAGIGSSVPNSSSGVSDTHGGTTSVKRWFGVALRSGSGAVVLERVHRGSPAAAAGLLPGDELISLQGVSVRSAEDVREWLSGAPIGEALAVSIRRGSAQRLLSLSLEPEPSVDERMRRKFVGSRAPSISRLLTAQGSQVPSWAALRGHVVVLEFWAGWCVPCRALTPTLNRYHQTLSAKGVRVLAASSEPFEEAVRAAHGLGLQYPVFVDPDGLVTREFDALTLPSVFVIDKRGTIREVIVGLQRERLLALETLLPALIGE